MVMKERNVKSHSNFYIENKVQLLIYSNVQPLIIISFDILISRNS